VAVRVHNIKLSPDAGEDAVLEQALLRLRKKKRDVLGFRIVRQSVDARKKQVHLVYTAELRLQDESHLPDSPDVRLLPEEIC